MGNTATSSYLTTQYGAVSCVASVNVINVAKPVRGTFLGGKVALKLVRVVLDWAKSPDVRPELFHISFDKADRLVLKLVTVGSGAQ
nr:hypothetical protein [uncultured Celeribacter sp.]